MVGDAQTHAGTGTSHSHTLTHAQNCHTGVATLRILSLYHCTLVRTSFVRIYSPVPIPLPIHAHYRLLIHIFTQKIVQVRNKTSENAYTLDESGGNHFYFLFHVARSLFICGDKTIDAQLGLRRRGKATCFTIYIIASGGTAKQPIDGCTWLDY